MGTVGVEDYVCRYRGTRKPHLGTTSGTFLKQVLAYSFAQSLQQQVVSKRVLGCNMADGPNPLDPKYAQGAEQARQDVMVGVSAAMTLIGGQSWCFSDVLEDLLTN